MGLTLVVRPGRGTVNHLNWLGFRALRIWFPGLTTSVRPNPGPVFLDLATSVRPNPGPVFTSWHHLFYKAHSWPSLPDK